MKHSTVYDIAAGNNQASADHKTGYDLGAFAGRLWCCLARSPQRAGVLVANIMALRGDLALHAANANAKV